MKKHQLLPRNVQAIQPTARLRLKHNKRRYLRGNTLSQDGDLFSPHTYLTDEE